MERVSESDLRSAPPEPALLLGRSIRNGKEYADFMITTIHAHQGPWVAQRWAFEDSTPDFLIELAHKAIDNGSDDNTELVIS